MFVSSRKHGSSPGVGVIQAEILGVLVANMCMYIYIYMCVCVCVSVLMGVGGVERGGLGSFLS